MGQLSNGFTGGSTRGMGTFMQELEIRMKKLDLFTDEFSPPGAAEKVPGADFTKRTAPYAKPHDNTVPEAKFRGMAAAGDPKDQEPADVLDRIEYRIQAPIKNPYNEFPGSYQDKEIVNDLGAFDPVQTDPSLIDEKQRAAMQDPEKFSQEVEKRMKHLQEDAQTISYKGHSVSTYKSFDQIGVKIDGYLLNQKFSSSDEAIRQAKEKIDKTYH